jgi:AraC family transcriptional activator of pobA
MDRSREGLNNPNMLHEDKPEAPLPPSPPAPAREGTLPLLPTYALYGETGARQATDWLHCESIAARSALHDWEIRVHRHTALFQILYIRRGRCEARLQTETLSLAGPCVLVVPALVPHGFRFEPGVDGSVVTVLEQHLAGLLQGAPGLAVRVMQPHASRFSAGSDDADNVEAAVQALEGEFHAGAAWRDLAIDTALLRLMLAIGRSAPSSSPSSTSADTPSPAQPAAPLRAQAHVQRLRAEVEARFREQPGLPELARPLGITPTQLNRVCHQVLGHAALDLLHARLVLEAQRELVYTALSVKQIALGLGFSDAGYFSRFFRRQTGTTPTAWRGRAGR